MDQDGTDHDALLTELKKRLNENCMDFSENADGALEPELPAGEKEQQNLIENKFSEEFLESLAMCDEKLLEKYLETGEVSRREIIGLIEMCIRDRQCSCNGKRFRSLSDRDSLPYRFPRNRRMAFRWWRGE